jgi:hypothetical protein
MDWGVRLKIAESANTDLTSHSRIRRSSSDCDHWRTIRTLSLVMHRRETIARTRSPPPLSSFGFKAAVLGT